MNRLIGSKGRSLADVFTRKKRSEIMSRIRSRETAPELLFKRFLEETGVTFTYQPAIFGKPDFLLKGNIVVFIDSKFWHGKGNVPHSNHEYWIAKLEKNRRRDREVNKRLRNEGFRVVRVEDKTVMRMFKDLNGVKRR